MAAHSIFLQQAFNPKKNSFGFLRFMLAVLVIFSHCHSLGNFGLEGMLGGKQESYGGIAVCCFFVISGFLITRSYVQSQALWRFLWNRSLRFFLGFWVCMLLTILAFAPIIHFAKYGSLQNYFQFQPENPLDYFKVNFFLEMSQYDINQLLKKDMPFPGAFNGSLWSLIYEFRCYLAVAILGWLGILSKQRFAILGLFVSFWLLYALDIVIPGVAAKVSPYFLDIQNLKLSVYFLSGAVFYLYAPEILIDLKVLLFALSVLILSLKYQYYPTIAPILLSYIVFCTAIYLPFSSFDKYGDFSYGLYIYAFPVQQTLTFFGYNKYGFFAYFILSFVLTLLLSIGSWFFVEQPCLKLKKFKFKEQSA